jgi:hypothetical protein
MVPLKIRSAIVSGQLRLILINALKAYSGKHDPVADAVARTAAATARRSINRVDASDRRDKR